MGGKPRPSPCYLDKFEVVRVDGGRKVWRSDDKESFFTWDSLHGEIEVFNMRGKHLGALDPVTGRMIKKAVKGRKIDV
ncbi:MAG: colicin E3/pyocin S6 family cytotoxin [Erysipelotrichales bacterium]|nr:colicin E3/pyocin S6 family cytotoxin [Erysipelotrichales bacterium]